jgi:uncharacterized protein YacL
VFVFRRLRNFVRRRRTDLANRPALIPLLVAALVGVVAFILAPDVSNRNDADGLTDLFIGTVSTLGILMTAMVAVQVALSANRAVARYLTKTSYGLVALGLVASLLGLIASLALSLYRYAFAISIAAVAVGIVVLIVVAGAHGAQGRDQFIRSGGEKP